MASGVSSLSRKLDGAPPVLPPISPLIDRRKLSPSAFEPVAEVLEKNGFSVGWNDGSLQVGGSPAASGLCTPTFESPRSSFRPRTSGFLSFSKARDIHGRPRTSSTPARSAPGCVCSPAPPRTPQPRQQPRLSTERFSRIGNSPDTATAAAAAIPTTLTSNPLAANNTAGANSGNGTQSNSNGPSADASNLNHGSSGSPANSHHSSSSHHHPGGHHASAPSQRRPGSAASAPLPSSAQVANTMGINIPMENLRDSERPGAGSFQPPRTPAGAAGNTGSSSGGGGGSGGGGTTIIHVPLGTPSPHSPQAQAAAFRASRGQALMVFNELDSDKNGKVTRSELEAAALSLGFSLEQAQRLWDRLDRTRRGYLEATDWGIRDAFQQIQLFSTRYLQKYMGVPDVSSSSEQIRKYNRAQEVMQVKSLPAAVNMARANAVARGARCAGSTGNPIHDTFLFMDVDRSGVLSKEEIRDAFFAMGVYLSDQVIEQIMEIFDKDRSGAVQYHEFERTMFPPVR
ncbi:hypothetical protein Agub_g8550 [Astrephomene gubernaculifera]|uniref:EF-hand domain-containing protein n=1 Tax=Astrephomene gubernaculifera TaxID=47775 RepID=A0AAD3DS67_9CHLO|nr:hypothetical protein Agub_g8550 [Astrephomene gubernaculifera]